MAISYWIIHAIRGRIRLRAPIVKGRADIAESLVHFLKRQPGVTDIRINCSCASVIVSYDPNRWTQEALVQKIEDFSPNIILPCNPDVSNNPVVPAQQSFPKNDSEKPGFELMLSSTAVALSLMAGSVAAPVLPILLIGSALSIFKRAIDSLSRRKLNVDVLDASAATLLTLQGQIPKPPIHFLR